MESIPKAKAVLEDSFGADDFKNIRAYVEAVATR